MGRAIAQFGHFSGLAVVSRLSNTRLSVRRRFKPARTQFRSVRYPLGMPSARNRLTPALFLPTTQCLAAAALFGASTPLSKSLLTSLGPFALAGLLYLVAA